MADMRDSTEMLNADQKLLSRLETERSSWDSHWQDLSDHFNPRSSRFNSTDRNQGNKKNAKLLSSVPVRAARTAKAGMFSQITSPARPWFSLSLADYELAEKQDVKEWLDECTEQLRGIMASSNFYKCSPAMFGDLLVYGTHAQQIDEDDQDIIRCYPFPVGSYYLASSSRLAVDTCMRKFAMTNRQLLQRFGAEALDQQQRDRAKDNPEGWCDAVVYVCSPNPEYDPKKLESRYKAFQSRYYVQGAKNYLSIKGYDEFPIIAPRWSATGEDTYGESPGMIALPDARTLMIYEKRVAQAIEKKLHPTLKAPIDMEAKGINQTPGSTVFSGSPEKIGSIYAADAFQIDHALNAKREKEEAISSTMYVDLFLMLMNSDRRQITAEEIRARQEEKILALGEPLERLNDEALGPAIERIFSIAVRRGRIPPPPPDLVEYQRQMGDTNAIKVEYVSALHQVQKMVKLGQIDRAVQFMGTLAGAYPSVIDNLDADEAFREVSEALGLPPQMVRSKEQLDQIRKVRAEQQAQQQMMQQAAATVQGAKIMSETDTGGQNALTDLQRSVAGAV